MIEGWDAVEEGLLIKEGREKMGGAGRTRGSQLGNFISMFVRGEINMAWGPVNLNVENLVRVFLVDLFGREGGVRVPEFVVACV